MKQTQSNLNKKSVQTSILDYVINERSEETFTFEFEDEDCASKDGIEPPRTKELQAKIQHDQKDEPSRETNYQDENGNRML
jgi:hypothetical protein